MWSVFIQAVRRRRAALAWWALGIAATVALLAVAYPTVRDNNELDKTFANLPPGLEALLGLSGGNVLGSPAGYLKSQFFANVLPVMLLVFGIGAAARTIAGDEGAGSLESLLANPISRVRVALARLGAVAGLLAALAVVCAVSLIALAPASGLDRGLSAANMTAATVAATLLALTFAAVAFAVGAATGNRGAALATALGLAAGGYVLEGLAGQVAALRPCARIVRSGESSSTSGVRRLTSAGWAVKVAAWQRRSAPVTAGAILARKSASARLKGLAGRARHRSRKPQQPKRSRSTTEATSTISACPSISRHSRLCSRRPPVTSYNSATGGSPRLVHRLTVVAYLSRISRGSSSSSGTSASGSVPTQVYGSVKTNT